jgi:hypothetical protein
MRALQSTKRAKQRDSLNISPRLDELSTLKDGWLDGKGLPPAKGNLDWLADSFGKWFDAELRPPYLYPTAEGDIQAEWSFGDWEISLEIDLKGRSAEYQALNLRDNSCDEFALSLESSADWPRLNQALRRLSFSGPTLGAHAPPASGGSLRK